MTASALDDKPPTSTVDRREQLADRLIDAMAATLETHAVYLGVELGLYRSLAVGGPASADQLAARAGIAPRYAREWLEQQAVAGMVDYSPANGTFTLPAEHAEVLTDADSPFFAAGGTQMLAGVARALDALPAAYRTGGGVPYSAYGEGIRHGIAAFNRPMFRHELASSWFPAVPEVHERLRSGPSRVLDLGCGTGTSSIAIAAAYPQATVVGVDLDEASIAEAQGAARAAGVADRVSFEVSDAASAHGDAATYDLVTIFEALHDMGDPAGVLRGALSALSADGSILVADEKVAEEFQAPGDLIERFNYGWSVLHCLPATLAEDPVEATGTVLRPATVRRWAREAGFGRCVVIDIDNPFWRFYRLTR